jgi:hypothetical protein
MTRIRRAVANLSDQSKVRHVLQIAAIKPAEVFVGLD